MTVQIDVRPETAAKFQAAATALNLSLQEYLDKIAGNIVLVSSEPDSQSDQQYQAAQPRNEAMLAIIERNHARLKDMPVRGSTEETLKMIRRARAGEMWGYEPTDADTED